MPPNAKRAHVGPLSAEMSRDKVSSSCHKYVVRYATYTRAASRTVPEATSAGFRSTCAHKIGLLRHRGTFSDRSPQTDVTRKPLAPRPATCATSLAATPEGRSLEPHVRTSTASGTYAHSPRAYRSIKGALTVLSRSQCAYTTQHHQPHTHNTQVCPPTRAPSERTMK